MGKMPEAQNFLIPPRIIQGKRLPTLPGQGDADQAEEVSDEDESAEANDTVQQEKQKKGSKLKLSAVLSTITGMKSVHFKSTSEIPKGKY